MAFHIIQILYITKHTIIDWLGTSEPMLHFTVGLCIYLVAFVLVRSPRVSLLLVAALQLINELNDFAVNVRPMSVFVSDTISDTFFTLAVPFVLTIWFRRKAAARRRAALASGKTGS